MAGDSADTKGLSEGGLSLAFRRGGMGIMNGLRIEKGRCDVPAMHRSHFGVLMTFHMSRDTEKDNLTSPQPTIRPYAHTRAVLA